jgi:hypothetical protein
MIFWIIADLEYYSTILVLSNIQQIMGRHTTTRAEQHNQAHCHRQPQSTIWNIYYFLFKVQILSFLQKNILTRFFLID